MKWPKNKLLISMLHCHPRMQTLFTVTTPFYSTLNSHLWKSFLESLPQKTICCLSFRFSFTRWKILVLSISNQFSCYNTKSTCKPKGAKTLTTQGSIGEAVSKTAFVLQEHTVQGKGRAPETPWYKAVSKSSTWGKRQEEYKEFNEREKKITSCSCIQRNFTQEGKSKEGDLSQREGMVTRSEVGNSRLSGFTREEGETGLKREFGEQAGLWSSLKDGLAQSGSREGFRKSKSRRTQRQWPQDWKKIIMRGAMDKEST